MLNILRNLISWIYPIRIEETNGELHHVLEVNMYRGKKYLDTENVNYSFGALQEVFDHAFVQTNLYSKKINSVLILGFGSGCVANLLLKHCNPNMHITGVEADSEVIRLTEKHFPLTNPDRTIIIHEDALRFVAKERNQYDLIIVDLFLEDIVPDECQSRDFLLLLRKLLTENGIVYFNKMDNEQMNLGGNELEKRMKTVFHSVEDIRVHRGGAGNHVYYAKLK